MALEINEIKTKYNELNAELRKTLATMQRNYRVFAIRDQIKDLQRLCPHNSGSYDFSQSDECPYCGRKFKG